MPNAIVTGATGILGREIVFELGKDTKTWPTVYALSRSKKEDYPSNVKHTHLDLQGNPEDMAKELGHVDAEYVFFTAYLAQDDEDDATKVNGDMLQNFISALKLTGAAKKIKRFILTTGCKQYGVHFGAPKNPMQESDHWLKNSSYPSNFYYRQQEILKKEAEQNNWEWTVTYPNDVVGVAKGNFMNLVSAIGIYASICKELHQPLIWPGSPHFYTMFDSLTCSTLHAQFNTWAAFAPGAANQAFNVVNGDVESWQNLWPKVAAKFDLKIPEKMFEDKDFKNDFGDQGLVMPLKKTPPISEFAAQAGLLDTPALQQSLVEAKIDLSKWAQRAEVKEAWKKLSEREGLDASAFDNATWMFLNFVLGRNFDLVISMSKARKAGWTGYQDTWESIEGALERVDYFNSGKVEQNGYKTPEALGGALSEKVNDGESDTVTFRLFVVEDLSREVIELLGSNFDIPPAFFREHVVDYAWYNVRDPWFDPPNFDTAIREQGWLQFRFVTARYFETTAQFEAACEEAESFNVLRRPDDDQNNKTLWDKQDAIVGITRARATLWSRKAEGESKPTVGVLLLDPTIQQGAALWRGYRNWESTPSMSTPSGTADDGPPRTSFFDDFVYWSQRLNNLRPPMPYETKSQVHIPIQALLHLICAEWFTMGEYIRARLGQIDWEVAFPEHFLRHQNVNVDIALKKLHIWRRLVPLYREMLADTLRHAIAGDIRVIFLRLATQEHDADVEAELHIIPARYSMFYALSYCWGDEEGSKNITLNGQKFRIPLWIDAISINQGPSEVKRSEERVGMEDMIIWRQEKEKSNREKSREIRRMDEIYKSASKVLIWLGQDTKFPLIPTNICSDPEKLRMWMLTLENKQAAIQALNQPYFRRAWCTQEVALARHASVILGPNIIAWHHLGPIVTPLTLPETVLYHSRIYHSESPPLPPQRWNSRPDSVTRHAKAAVERLSYLHLMIRSVRNNKEMSLFSLLVSTIHCESTYAIDKLYSLWSMAKDARLLLPDPDYKRTKADVFTEFTRSWINEYKRKDILSAIESHEDDERLEMPGWVPDWSSQKRKSSPLLYPLFTDGGFTNVEEARLYDASAGFDRMSRLTILDDFLLFKGSHRFSDNEGISCGKIRFCVSATYQGGSVDDVVFLSLMGLTKETVPDQGGFGKSFAAYRNFVRALVNPSGSSGADEEQSDINLTDQMVEDFIWAVVAGRTPSGSPYQTSPELPYEIVRREGKVTGLTPRKHASEEEDQPWYRHLESIMTGRRIALTEQGHVGLVPESARPGDEIGILSDCSVPLVFRDLWPVPARRILGDSYFKRMMQGEMVKEAGGEEEIRADIIHCWLRNCGSTLEIPERVRELRDRDLLKQEINRLLDEPLNLGQRSGPPISAQSRPQGRVFSFW
ncbi:NAD dependent epimerase/dehydratase family protein, partial [Aureobasidium melanogenum]